MAQDDEVVTEEIFGPVVAVQSFEDEADGLELANGTRSGLSSSVWTGITLARCGFPAS